MPATVVDAPLGVSCVFTDGSRAECHLGSDLLPQLARQLMDGLADLVKPHGDLDAESTVRFYQTSMRAFLRTLDRFGFAGAAQDLTRAMLAECFMAMAPRYELHSRAVLRRLDDLQAVLGENVRHFVDGRAFNPRTRTQRRTLLAYSETEWRRLTDTCEELVTRSYTAYRAGLAEAERGQDIEVGGWSRENVQFTLLHQGPIAPGFSVKRGGKARNRRLKELYPNGQPEAVAVLFPSPEVVFAYRVLFGIRTGIVPDGIEELGLDDLDWAGDAAVLVDYIKGRTARESLTLSRSAVRLLERWIEHSRITRRFAPAERRNELWLRYCPYGKYIWSAGVFDTSTRQRWVRDFRLVDDHGQPLHLHAHRIRTTFEASRDRRVWTGSSRATIDPNHSPQVEGDHYLAGQTPTQKAATEGIIESAQHDLVRRARAPMVVEDDEDAASAARKLPQVVDEFGLDDSALAELLGGERDVFAAGCADAFSGLHGPKGKPCPARPWVCLLCPLALFAPRHVPNLMRLRAFFSRQWQQTPAAAFMSYFGPYAARLDALLTTTYFAEPVLRQAAAEVTGDDSELPLRPEELTA